MKIIDSQIHVWEATGPTQPWNPPAGEAHTAERCIATMDEAGVDAALLVTMRLYGDDNGYGLASVARQPDRLALVGRVPDTHESPDGLFASWRRQAGMVGWRLTLLSDADFEAAESGPQRAFLEAAERHRVPACVWAPGRIPRLGRLAERYPNLPFVLDHMCLGVSENDPPVADPLSALPDVLALAPLVNVTLKASAFTHWSREPFPFRDLWPSLHRVLSAFGVDRVMWGTDRTHRGKRTPYREALHYVLDTNELSPSDKAAILGGTLQRVFDWHPEGAAAQRP